MRGKKIAIGVSGGRDSICLLHAALNCGAIERSDITAVHVNHCLREQADSDELFVREFCAKNGVDFCAYRVDVNAESEKKGLTVEQAARNLRYAVFYGLLDSGAADVVLTAHHALDNAETVLMHLFRGAGLDGMCGMNNAQAGVTAAVPLHLFRGAGLDGLRGMNNAQADVNAAVPLHMFRGAGLDGMCGMNNMHNYADSAVPIVRPFIDVYPSELDEYCVSNGLKFVVDDTNFEDDADRNFIRLNVIPMIEKRYAGAVRAINALSRECAGVCEYLDAALDSACITYSDGAVLVDDRALCGALAARYVRRALEYFTTVDVTREQTERVVALAHMRTGACVELSSGIVAAHEYGRVALYIPRLDCGAEFPVALGGNYIDGLAVDIAQSDESPRSVKGGAVDWDKLNGAVLRFRRDGDMFTPFGGKRKKLKQYFIDRKIPKRLRDRTPLICCGDEVLVIVGTDISELVKQTPDTAVKAVVRLRR